MGRSSRVVALILFLLVVGVVTIIAQVVETSAAIENSTVETVSTSDQGNGQRVSPYMLKRGDNEFGFSSAVGFKATTIFGGLHEDEARDRKFFIAAFRYGRRLFANKREALQFKFDAIPEAAGTGTIDESSAV